MLKAKVRKIFKMAKKNKKYFFGLCYFYKIYFFGKIYFIPMYFFYLLSNILIGTVGSPNISHQAR